MKEHGLDIRRLRLVAICTVCVKPFLKEVNEMNELLDEIGLLPAHLPPTSEAQAAEQTRPTAFDGIAMRKLLDDNLVSGYYFMKNIAGVIGQRLVSKCAQLMSILV